MHAAAPSIQSSQEIRGRFTGQVLFENRETGYVIAMFRPRGGRSGGQDDVKVGGTITDGDLRARDVCLWGNQGDGSRGPLFRVLSLRRGPSPFMGDPPPEGVEAYCAEAFKGYRFGPAAARKLVADLKAGAWEALTREPYVLAHHMGSLSRAMEMYGVIQSEGIPRATALAHLMGLGLSHAYARRILDDLGLDALDRIAVDPYCIVGVPGIGFATADTIARKRMGIAPDDERRMLALARGVLAEAANEGSTSLAVPDVVAGLERLGKLAELGVDPTAVLDRALAKGAVTRDGGDLYLPDILAAEQEAAEGLARMQMRPVRPGEADILADRTLTNYDPRQREAVAAGVVQPIVMISGGPGTGKTTTARAIVRIAMDRGIPVTLAATTGNAAARLTDSILEQGSIDLGNMPLFGKPGSVGRAVTIDSLVGNRGARKSLPAGIVLVDEFSMTDVRKLARIVGSAGSETSLVFMGDPEQLPPVLAGNAARDVRDSQVIPIVTLERVHRAGKDSLVALNIQRIRDGRMPILRKEPKGQEPRKTEWQLRRHFTEYQEPHRPVDMDCYKVDTASPEDGARKVVAVAKAMADQGYDPVRDIQVYAPMKGRTGGKKPTFLGTKNLNAQLQETFNPAGAALSRMDKEGLQVRVGDPVLHTENCEMPDAGDPLVLRELKNGMKGIVAEAAADGSAVVEFSGSRVRYAPSQIRKLSLAYAVTVHKGQGQEQKVAILALDQREHYVMLSREQLYVGLSRAKERFVAVGTDTAVRLCMERQAGAERRTRLAERTVECRQQLERAASLPAPRKRVTVSRSGAPSP
jgi:exodeoxyribonuclease V alpha subunit